MGKDMAKDKKAEKVAAALRPILEHDEWAIDKFKPYARNPRENDEQVQRMVGAIREFGFRIPVVALSDGTVVDGHLRLKAAQVLGMATVPVVLADDLDPAHVKAFRILANQSANWAAWNEDFLKLELEDIDAMGLDLELTGLDESFIESLLQDTDKEGNTDPDDVPDTGSSAPVSQPGDVWQCGQHRVMCGDSTDKAALAILMDGRQASLLFTDPPYGVDTAGGRQQLAKKSGRKKISNDALRGEDLRAFILDVLRNVPLKDGAHFYVCYDHETQAEFCQAVRDMGWTMKNTIVWNKNGFGLNGHKGYRPKYELIAFGYVGGGFMWYGDNAQGDVWDFPRPRKRPGNHPTPKPVALVCKALRNSSQVTDIVVDVFGGSGSTLVACEKTGRICYTIELEPEYVDTIVLRWQQFTGQQAVRAGDGVLFDDLAGQA